MSTQVDTAVLPDSGERPLVVLVDAPSGMERRLVDRWLGRVRGDGQTGGRGLEVLPADSEQLAARLTRGDNPLLVPVRVVWATDPEPDGTLLRLADVLTRGWALRNRARAARRSPPQHEVVVGRPATVRELLRRHRRERGLHRQRRLRAVRGPPGDARARPRRARAHRQPLQGAPRGGRRRSSGRRTSAARSAGSPPRPAGRRTTCPPRRPPTSRASSPRSTPAPSTCSPACCGPCTRRRGPCTPTPRGSSRCASSTPSTPLVFLPSHRSLHRPVRAGRRAAQQRLPAQPRPRRRQPAHPRARAARAAQRHHLHPPQLRRGPGLQGRGARVLLVAVRPSASTSSGTWRAAAPAPGSCARRSTGLLSDVASAVETRRAEDVYLVPVSIIHDQLQEVHQMAAEQTGAAKTPGGPALARRLRPGAAPSGRRGARELRRAAVAARRALRGQRPGARRASEPDGRGRRRGRGGGLRGPPPGPAEDRVRGLRPHQPRDAGDAHRAGGPRPARGA